MAETFMNLDSMRKLVTSARADLKQLRDISAKLQKNVAAVNDPQRFTPAHIRTETGKLRSSALDIARGYLASERTAEMLGRVRAQDGAWTLPRYLAHAASDPGTNDIAKLLRRLIMLQTLSRCSTAGLVDLAQNAADHDDFSTLGTVYAEAQFRKEQGDEAAGMLIAGIATVTPPEIATVRELVAEARQLQEHVTYTVRSIETGGEDLGVKHERWVQEAAERQAETQHGRERGRERMAGAGAQGNGSDLPPAA